MVVVQKIEQNIVETNIPERGLETLEVPMSAKESLQRRRMFDHDAWSLGHKVLDKERTGLVWCPWSWVSHTLVG